MARRTTPKELPEGLREAVERTMQATAGSAKGTRERAQGAVDDLVQGVDDIVRGAEAGLVRSREVVRGAIDDRRPATQEDIRELKAELRAIGRRLGAIEERLPAAPAGRRAAAGKGSSGGAKRPASKRRT